MSEIDERIVSLQFDNKKFQKDIEATIKALDTLDSKLAFEKTPSNIDKVTDSIEVSTKSIKNMSSATEELNVQFNALQVIGITALSNLTTAAMRWGVKAAASFWNPIIEGGKTRSQNIANAKFQIEGLGKSWSQYEEAINYGVKDTAYGLDEAAKVASQLLASGRDNEEQMKSILRGISGVAAMTNSSYSEIGDIYTTVASNGKLMTMQMRQLSARGLNVAATLADALDTTEEAINSMVTKGQISFDQFAKAMDDAFGEHAKEANKTFTGALSNMRAALSRLGEAFATPVFDLGIKVFNNLRDAIDAVTKALKFGSSTDPNSPVGMFKRLTEWIGKMVDGLFEGKDILQVIVDLVVVAWTYIRPIIRAIMEVFYSTNYGIKDAISNAKDGISSLQLTGEKAEGVKNIFKVLFQTIKLGGVIVKNILKIAKPILVAIGRALGVAVENSDNIFDVFSKMMPVFMGIADYLGDKIAAGITKFLSGASGVFGIIRQLYPIVMLLVSGLTKALSFIIPILINLAYTLLPIIKNGVKLVFELFTKGVSFLGAAIIKVKELIPNFIAAISAGAAKIASIIRSLFGITDTTANAVEKASDKLESDDGKSDKFGAAGSGKYMSGKLDNGIALKADQIVEDTDEANKKVTKSSKKTFSLFDGIIGVLSGIGSAIAFVGKAIFVGLGTIGTVAANIFVGLINGIASVVSGFFEFAKTVGKTVIDFMSDLDWAQVALYGVLAAVIGMVLSSINIVSGLIGGALMISATLLASTISTVITSMADLLKWGTTFMLSLALLIGIFAILPESTMDKVKDNLDYIANWLTDILKKISGILMLYAVTRIGASILQLIPKSRRALGTVTDSMEALAKSIKYMVIGVVAALAEVAILAIMINKIDGFGDSLTTAIDQFKRIIKILGVFIGVIVAINGVFTALSKAGNTNTEMNRFSLIQIYNNMAGTGGIIMALGNVLTTAMIAIAAFAILDRKHYHIDEAITNLRNLLIILGVFFGVLLLLTKSIAEETYKTQLGQKTVTKALPQNEDALAGLAQFIKQIGSFLIKIAAAMAILSIVEKLNFKGFIAAGITIGVVLGMVIAMLAILSHTITKGKKYNNALISQFTAFMISLSTILLALSATFLVISLMDTSKFKWGQWVLLGVAIATIAGTLILVTKLLKYSYITSTSASAIISIFAGLSAILLAMMGVFIALSAGEYDGYKIGMALIMVAGMIGIICAVGQLIKSINSINFNSGTTASLIVIFSGITAILLAMMALSIAIGVNSYDTSSLLAIGLVMAGLAAILLGIFVLSESATDGTMKIAAISTTLLGLLLVVGALALLFTAISKMVMLVSAEQLKQVTIMLAVIEVFLLIFALIGSSGIGGAGTFTALAGLAAALLGFAAVIVSFGAAAALFAWAIDTIRTALTNLTHIDFDLVWELIEAIVMMGAAIALVLAVIAALGAIGSISFLPLIIAVVAIATIIAQMKDDANTGWNFTDAEAAWDGFIAYIDNALKGVIDWFMGELTNIIADVNEVKDAREFQKQFWTEQINDLVDEEVVDSKDDPIDWYSKLDATKLTQAQRDIIDVMADDYMTLYMIEEGSSERRKILQARSGFYSALAEKRDITGPPVTYIVTTDSLGNPITIPQSQREKEINEITGAINATIPRDGVLALDPNAFDTSVYGPQPQQQPAQAQPSTAAQQAQAAGEKYAGIDSGLLKHKIIKLDTNITDMLIDLDEKAYSTKESVTNITSSLTNGIVRQFSNANVSIQNIVGQIGSTAVSTFNKISSIFSGTSTKLGASTGKYVSGAATNGGITNLTTDKIMNVTKGLGSATNMMGKITSGMSNMYVPTYDTNGNKTGYYDTERPDSDVNHDDWDTQAKRSWNKFTGDTAEDLGNWAVEAADWLYKNVGIDLREQAKELQEWLNTSVGKIQFDLYGGETILEKFGLGDLSNIIQKYAEQYVGDFDITSAIDTSDFLSSSNSALDSSDWGSTSSSSASDIASSDSSDTGTSDISSSTGNISNYYYTQNNYSPEALSRSEIYKQTQRQLTQWGGWVKSNA